VCKDGLEVLFVDSSDKDDLFALELRKDGTADEAVLLAKFQLETRSDDFFLPVLVVDV
jgi:hypothetical protein